MLNRCSSMHVKSQSCIVLFDLLSQQLYGILGQPSYLRKTGHYIHDFLDYMYNSNFGDKTARLKSC